jgi:hypothetical protein
VHLRQAVKVESDNARQYIQNRFPTPIAYLDAPDFQKFWDKDAKMLVDAIKRIGKLEIPEAK